MALHDNIFLIGFMGSGKTHWGKLWAAEKGMEFFDLDEMIEQEEQRTIAAIFEQKGEAYFRDKETSTLKTFAVKNNCIIACGGGAACFNNNMQWMNEHGITVYLSATAPDILKRVLQENEQEKRPVIKNIPPDKLLDFIENKLQEREMYYRQSKIILPVNDITTASIHTINRSLV
ncbi:shikimate kinase [Ferruginibacter sp.]